MCKILFNTAADAAGRISRELSAKLPASRIAGIAAVAFLGALGLAGAATGIFFLAKANRWQN